MILILEKSATDLTAGSLANSGTSNPKSPIQNPDRTYALAMNFLDFGRFLAGAAREKSSNCVSPTRIDMSAVLKV